ncbi:AAA family ATPase [Streptomyces sp. NBC_01604]|uniref:AAA family ATPase n=1 Tax=Streptomyces sp. NBC_01604 TaxID=2975894 RepID=UPI00386CF017
MDAQDTAKRLRAISDELSDRFYERADVVRTLVVTLLAGQHSLVLGPPGTAKSELARELTGRVEGASYWEILLSKFTAPTRMFGPVDVAALARGEYRQVYEGRATTAHVAFIDEIFKCSTAALNETLGFVNERIYHPESGGEPIRCPLIGAITASNELPSGEDTAAIYDRLLVRIEVGYLADPSNFAALVRSAVSRPVAPARTTVELAALQHAVTEAVPAVDVPEGILDAVCTLRAALRRKELVASDRRWRQAVGLLQASAYLDGRRAVALTDLPTVEREVLHLVNRSWGLSKSEPTQPHAPNGLGRTGPRRTQPRNGDTDPVRGSGPGGRFPHDLATWVRPEATGRPRTITPMERGPRTLAPYPASQIARSA